MTIDQIASVIRSNISNGLKEVGNYQYPIDAIKDEISNVRGSIVKKMSEQGSLVKPEYFTQRFDNIELDLQKFPIDGFSETNDAIPHCKIWKVAMTAGNTAIVQFGPPDMSTNFKIYYDINELTSHKYKRVIRNRPYVFIDLAHDKDGMHDAWLFNTPQGLKYISERSIKADPVRILEADGYWGDDEEFPAPSSVQDQIITTLSERYIRYYRNLNHPNQVNDGTNHS